MTTDPLYKRNATAPVITSEYVARMRARTPGCRDLTYGKFKMAVDVFVEGKESLSSKGMENLCALVTRRKSTLTLYHEVTKNLRSKKSTSKTAKHSFAGALQNPAMTPLYIGPSSGKNPRLENPRFTPRLHLLGDRVHALSKSEDGGMDIDGQAFDSDDKRMALDAVSFLV